MDESRGCSVSVVTAAAAAAVAVAVATVVLAAAGGGSVGNVTLGAGPGLGGFSVKSL